MKALTACGFVLLMAGFCFGGPMIIFSYHTQSIVFAAAITVYCLLRHPHARMLPQGGTPADQHGDMMDTLLNMFGAKQDQPVGVMAGTQVRQQPAATMQQGGQSAQGSASTPYQEEAQIINNLFKTTYNIHGEIRWQDPAAIVLAPNFVGYAITPFGKMKFTDLQDIEDNIGRDIKMLSRGGDGDDVGVLAVNSQPPVLQVTRRKTRPLLWSERPAEGEPMTFSLGYYWRGTRRMPLTIDLKGLNCNYITGAFIGQPRSGKSTGLKIALDSLLETTPANMLEVYGIDIHADSFSDYAGVPHFKRIVSTIEESLQILEQFAKWCDAAHAPNDGVYRLLVIDEFHWLMAEPKYGDACLEKFIKIMAGGGKYKIRVWTATQSPDSTSYPSVLKRLTHFFAATYIKNDNYVRSQLKIYGANKIIPQKELIFSGSEGDQRVNLFHYTFHDQTETLKELRHKWGSVAPVTQSSMIQAAPSDFPISSRAPTPGEVDCFAKMWVDMQFATLGKRSLNKLIDFVYGPGTKNAEKLDWIKEALGERELLS